MRSVAKTSSRFMDGTSSFASGNLRDQGVRMNTKGKREREGRVERMKAIEESVIFYAK